MFLTAHRVVAPKSADEGINAFFYRHGNFVWDGLPPEGIFSDDEPGELLASAIEIQPPGNRVRSFLDVVAPDETPQAEILRALSAFLERAHAVPLPWRGVVGRCFFHIGMEAQLAPRWRDEVAALYRRLTALRDAEQ